MTEQAGIVTLDLTDEDTTAAAVVTLDAGQRDRLIRALRDADSAEHDKALLDLIHEKLSEATHPHDPEAVGVVFTADQWDNGNFLTEHGTVVRIDGTTFVVTFDGAGDLLTDEYGSRGEDFTLYVHLRTGVMDTDDYPDDHPQTRFDVPVPASRRA